MLKKLLILIITLLFSFYLNLQKVEAKNCENNIFRSSFDVLKYKIDFSIDTSTYKIDGIVTINAINKSKSALTLQFDLQKSLLVNEVKYKNRPISFKSRQDAYFVHLNDLKYGDTFALEIVYSGIPEMALKAPWDAGLVATKDENGIAWLAMTSQGKGGSLWFPCKDIFNDEPDLGVDISIKTPSTLMAISNGQLINTINHPDNTSTWNWKIKNPINLYNITFYIGNYTKWEDTFIGVNGRLNTSFYVLKQNQTKAQNHFKMVPKMLEIFEDWMGPYPFYEDGYKLVEAPYLGMEHQSAIAYGNNYKMGYNGKNISSSAIGMLFDFIIVHESGHEWFGNNITANDQAYFWIQEGFTTYTEVMYLESLYGKDKAEDYLIGMQNRVYNRMPLQSKINTCNNDNVDNYVKGASIIHTIRKLMNDDVKFKMMIKKMNKTFYHQTITGLQMEQFIAQESGLNLNKTFDQFLRNNKIPVLKIKKTKDGFNYHWSNCIKGFDMSVKIWIDGKEKWLQPSTKVQSHIQKNISEIEMDKGIYALLNLKQ